MPFDIHGFQSELHSFVRITNGTAAGVCGGRLCSMLPLTNRDVMNDHTKVLQASSVVPFIILPMLRIWM